MCTHKLNPSPTTAQFPTTFSWVLWNAPIITSKCHALFLSTFTEDLDHPSGLHFSCSFDLARRPGGLFPSIANFRTFSLPWKRLWSYKSFHSLPVFVPAIYACVANITAVSISEVHFQFLGHLAPANVPSPSLLLLIIHSDFSIPTATILIPWLPSSWSCSAPNSSYPCPWSLQTLLVKLPHFYYSVKAVTVLALSLF